MKLRLAYPDMSEPEHSWLIEITRIGSQLKVTACDPVTGMEASIIAPSHSPHHYISALAIRKLRQRIEKAREQEG